MSGISNGMEWTEINEGEAPLSNKGMSNGGTLRSMGKLVSEVTE